MVQRRYDPKRGPVRFIPATLRVDRFSAGNGERVRQQLGLGELPIILSSGHVIPIRSRVPLIQALPRIVQQFPVVRVLVVGEVYYDEFQRLAEELGVADHVIVTGRVPHLEVPDYVAAATVESHDLDG